VKLSIFVCTLFANYGGKFVRSFDRCEISIRLTTRMIADEYLTIVDDSLGGEFSNYHRLSCAVFELNVR